MAVGDLLRRSFGVFGEENMPPVNQEELAERARLARSTQVAASVLREMQESMAVDTYPDPLMIERKLLDRGIIGEQERLHTLLPDAIETLTAAGDQMALEVESLEATPVAAPGADVSLEARQLHHPNTRRQRTVRRIGRVLRPALPH